MDEVTRLVDAAHSLSDRTMLMVLDSTGKRNAEMRHLQVKNIDSRSMLIHIQRGKGVRDRYVPLSPTLLETLRVVYGHAIAIPAFDAVDSSALARGTKEVSLRSHSRRINVSLRVCVNPATPQAPSSAHHVRPLGTIAASLVDHPRSIQHP